MTLSLCLLVSYPFIRCVKVNQLLSQKIVKWQIELTFFFHHCICRKKNSGMWYCRHVFGKNYGLHYIKTLPRKPIVVTSDFSSGKSRITSLNFPLISSIKHKAYFVFYILAKGQLIFNQKTNKIIF